MHRPADSNIPPHQRDEGFALLAAAAGLVAGLLTAVAAAAETPPGSGHLEEARRELESGRDSRAVFHLRRHLDRLPDDTEARSLLAVAYAQRAVAEAGLDRRDEAIWTFAVAQNLNDDFRTASLGAFGDAGGVTTNDETLAERVRTLRDHGRTSTKATGLYPSTVASGTDFGTKITIQIAFVHLPIHFQLDTRLSDVHQGGGDLVAKRGGMVDHDRCIFYARFAALAVFILVVKAGHGIPINFAFFFVRAFKFFFGSKERT